MKVKPIIYQLLPRTFTNYNPTRKPNGTLEENGCGKLNDITPRALKAIQDLGITHVWYTGVIRHATAARNNPAITKGQAGSPYSITDYYDIDPDLAVNEAKRMEEFEQLLARTHKQGLKVIIDFVPNHVSREYHSLCKPAGVKDLGETDNPQWAFSPLNNFYYLPNEHFAPTFPIDGYEEFPARATGNDCFSAHPNQNDWYETVKLNYGVFYLGGGEKQFDPVPNTWHKMKDILLFWAQKGVDGFRVDMAEMVPQEFWKWAITKVKKQYKDLIFIAECYNPGLYRDYIAAGFDYLYDKVGMYDYLRGVTSKNWPVEGISQQWQHTGDIREHMLYFLENHDEQRIASGFFCGSGSSAEPAMIVSATLGTNPVMIYAGQELGEKGMDREGFSGIDGRTTIFDYWGVSSLQAWTNNGQFDGQLLSDEQKDLRLFYQRLLTVAREHTAITEGKMFDLEYAQGEGFNKHEHFAYLRKSKDELLLVVINFDDKATDIAVRLPQEAFAYLKMRVMDKVTATDLLTHKKWNCLDLQGKKSTTFAWCQDAPMIFNLPAWKGVILQINKAK